MMKNNIWKNEEYFMKWVGKLKHFPIYERQKQEVIKDLKALGKTFLDVGGGDGRIGLGQVLDIQQGFDITKPWSEQGLGKDVKFDVVFTSLVLMCLDEEGVDNFIREAVRHATKAVYLYEEIPNFNRGCGQYKNPETKDKYNHLWTTHLKGFDFSREIAMSKPESWEKIIIRL